MHLLLNRCRGQRHPGGRTKRRKKKGNQPLKEERNPGSGTAPGKQAGARANIFSYWAMPRPNKKTESRTTLTQYTRRAKPMRAWLEARTYQPQRQYSHHHAPAPLHAQHTIQSMIREVCKQEATLKKATRTHIGSRAEHVFAAQARSPAPLKCEQLGSSRSNCTRCAATREH